MVKLTAMRGYSGSGKSTKAAEIAKETGAVIVNRDNLRKMLLSEWWTGDKQDEDRVTVAEEAQVSALLKAGTPVVVDATHLNPAYLRKWAKMASRLDAAFEVVEMRSSVEVCAGRDYARGTMGERSVGVDVIQGQAKRFPMEKWPTITAHPPLEIEPFKWESGLLEAIIVDIDGTLAHTTGRSPYDYTKVMSDRVDETIRDVVRDYRYGAYGKRCVIVMSGRDDTCRKDTLEWLYHHNIEFCDLFMRPTEARDKNGNKLPDFIVKYNLFNEHIRGQYNVKYVLDDRQAVVDMWRKLGLKCLQVEPGDF